MNNSSTPKHVVSAHLAVNSTRLILDGAVSIFTGACFSENEALISKCYDDVTVSLTNHLDAIRHCSEVTTQEMRNNYE